MIHKYGAELLEYPLTVLIHIAVIGPLQKNQTIEGPAYILTNLYCGSSSSSSRSSVKRTILLHIFMVNSKGVIRGVN